EVLVDDVDASLAGEPPPAVEVATVGEGAHGADDGQLRVGGAQRVLDAGVAVAELGCDLVFVSEAEVTHAERLGMTELGTDGAPASFRGPVCELDEIQHVLRVA